MQFNNGINLLYLSRVTLYFRAFEPIILRKNTGSAFRGLLGKTFKNMVCTNPKITSDPNLDCFQCIHKYECAYAIIYESCNPGTLKEMDKPKIPHPYIIDLPEELVDQKGSTDNYEYQPNDQIKLKLTLIGKPIKFLRFMVFSYDKAGRKEGIGIKTTNSYGHFYVEKVVDDYNFNEVIYTQKNGWLRKEPTRKFVHEIIDQSDILSSIGAMRIEFITRTRLDTDEKNVIGLHTKTISDPAKFWDKLINRAKHLCHFYCNINLDNPELTENIIMNSSIKFNDDRRKSNRQNSDYPYGGFFGEFDLIGDLSKLYLLLRLGEIIHVGKGTDVGYGQYKIKEIE